MNNNSINYPQNTNPNINWDINKNENNCHHDLNTFQHPSSMQVSSHYPDERNSHHHQQQQHQQHQYLEQMINPDSHDQQQRQMVTPPNFGSNSDNNYQSIALHHQQPLHLQARQMAPFEPSYQQPQQQQHHHHHHQHHQNLQQQRHNAITSAAPVMPSFNRIVNVARRNIEQDHHHHHQCRTLVSVDGIQSGVPTLTTPTLTPTTMRSIEQTFYELTNEQIAAPYQAGFVPPSAPLCTYTKTECNEVNESSSEDSRYSWNDPNLNEDISMATTDTSSVATTINDSTSFQNGTNCANSTTTSSTNDFSSVNIAIAAAAAVAAAAASNGGASGVNSNTSGIGLANIKTNSTQQTSRRNHGGRRPTKSANISPEEEEKRRIRRERNKLAAARCRKRRVDQTNELLDEVSILEKRREDLQKQIETLNLQKDELEFILEDHRPHCRKIRSNLLSVDIGKSLAYDPVSAIATSVTGRISPLVCIKDEPIDTTVIDTCDSLDDAAPPSPKRILISRNNPMIPPPLPALPNVATLSPSLAAASASLNTPTITTTSTLFGGNSIVNKSSQQSHCNKQRPSTLNVPLTITPSQSLALNTSVAAGAGNKIVTDINGVAITTPSTGMFNFDSLMDGGTGLTPVAGPLVPNCSSQNKHPLELATPTSEPSKLVSL